MYASLAGTTHELFRLAPPAGNTVADLLGGAGTPVGGRAQFSCSFAQGKQPQPRTAFAGFTAGAEQTGAGARTEAEIEARAEAEVEVEVEAAATLAMARKQAWRGSANAEFAAANGNMLLAAAALASMPSGSVTHGSALSGPAVADAECGCGAQRVARADTMAMSVAAGAHSAADLVEAMLDGGHEGEPGEAMDEADSAMPVRLPALVPTLLFKLLSGPAIGGATPQLRDAAARFDVVARPGDLLVRVARGEGWGNVAVVASHGLPSLDRLGPLGLCPEGGTRRHPGRYLHVIEITPRRVPAAAGLARRLADADNVVLADTLLLRPRTAPASDAESPAVACCAGASASAGTGGSEAFESAEQVTGPSCDTLSKFAHDSDALLPVHMAQINAAALNILTRGVRSVAVTGFASSDGANAYNQAPGMRRAEHVAGELRTVLERMRHGAGSSISITVASRGEEDQIASGAVTLNRRVTICPSAPPRPQVQPPAVRQKIFRMTGKSFIGRIGAHAGTLSCGLNTRLGHIPSPTTNPALRAFAALTDAGFSENPLTDGIFVTPPPDSKGYRLFSSAHPGRAPRHRAALGQRGGRAADRRRQGMRARRERLPAGAAAAGGHGAHLHAHRRQPGPGHLGRARPPAQRHGTGLRNDPRPHLRVRLAPGQGHHRLFQRRPRGHVTDSGRQPLPVAPPVAGRRHDARRAAGTVERLVERRAGRSDPCPLDASAVCIIHDTKVIDLSIGNDVHYFDLTVLRRPLSLRSLACMVSRRICCLLHPR